MKIPIDDSDIFNCEIGYGWRNSAIRFTEIKDFDDRTNEKPNLECDFNE
jgi:hypothetical protein